MKIKDILIVTLIALSFNACSKDNEADTATAKVVTDSEVETPMEKETNSSIDDSIDSKVEKRNIPISVVCVVNATASDIDTYQEVQKGDIIIKDEDNTTINLVVNSLGEQKICLQRGVAHIQR